MPQASDEDRAAWGTDGGVGEEKAMKHLADRGWRLTKDWRWVKPSPDFKPGDDDIGAIQFLIDEWDFGGIAPDDYKGPLR